MMLSMIIKPALTYEMEVVLILLLMDDALDGKFASFDGGQEEVLILLLMDDALDGF